MTAADTIAAVATAPGEGAISLLRISGPGALGVADRVCQAKCAPSQAAPRTQQRAILQDPLGRRLDDVLVCVHRAPRSYTGEDLVEISCHGGQLITRRALETVLAAGARLANPGEFTQRAFLNGKMDLTQAEAVMDLIQARTDLSLRAASAQLEGQLGRRVALLRDGLLDLTAHVEAYIDFPEEDIEPETGALLLARMDGVLAGLDALLATAAQGRILREGVRTVIHGAPNAGKSSLLNALLGQDRAIVSHLPGTTRDTIEEQINVRGIALRLIDTAGLRVSDDPLERAGMDRTRQSLAQADLALRVADASQPPSDDPAEGNGENQILVLNKIDLGLDPGWAGRPGDAVPVSCRTGEGIEALKDAIFTRVTARAGGGWDEAVAAINARHGECLRRARETLLAARQALGAGTPAEFVAIDLRAAFEAVGEISGGADTEDILGRIFASFCLGK
jgi:tRNA modification GTPase